MNNLRTVATLLFSQARHHPARLGLASLAVIAASCAVVWVVSGYDALVAEFDEHASTYMGRYDVIVVPGRAMGGTLPESLIDDFRADPAVAEVNPIIQSRVAVARSSPPSGGERIEPGTEVMGGSLPPVHGAPPLGPVLVGTSAKEPPHELIEGEWLSGPDSAVLTDREAKRLGVEVGGRVLVTSLTNQKTLALVGIVREPALSPAFGGPGDGRSAGGTPGGDRPAGRKGPRRGGRGMRGSAGGPPEDSADLGQRPGGGPGQAAAAAGRPSLPGVFGTTPASSALYVRREAADEINGYQSPPNVVQLALRDDALAADFVQRWQARLAKAAPGAKALDLTAVEAGMSRDRSVSGKRAQAYSATGMALLAALFIIFTTLSMGVSERTRELAVLRAVGLTRSQVVVLVFAESLLLALIGWGGGLLAGFGLLEVARWAQPDLFPTGVALGAWCVALTGLSALGGSLAAAVLPAWRAARVRPLEAMVSPRPWPHGHAALIAAAGGLLLIAINPIAVFVLQVPLESRSWVYWAVGYPAMVAGFLLLAPAAVLLAEKCFGHAVAAVLGLDFPLAATQLSANLWRTIGTTVALCVGLALYISTQTWGYSMLQPYFPGEWLPDALVAFQPVGLDEAELADLRAIGGVKSSACMPLAVEQPKLADFAPTPLLQHDNVIIIGVDPRDAFGGDRPFLDLEFLEGDASNAIAALAAGRGCLIAEDLARAMNLRLGDPLQLVPPQAADRRVAYRVAGIVDLPGWHWFTKFSGVRRHQTRTAGIVFASDQNVRGDFQLRGIEFCWFNVDSSVPLADIEAAMQSLADRHAGETYRSPDHGEVTAHRPSARVTAAKALRASINQRADAVIWGMSQLPLVTLAVASLAVVNTIVTSTRMRRWEMGVLRSQGMTRGALVRLVLAEAILIGVAACLLSLAFGLTAGWCGAGMAQYGGSFFSGMKAPFIVPWGRLALGISATLILCLAAAVWPALATGRTEPLRLLQAGRGTM
ncbi:MAG: ABC transporter permease [Thermoguttaceae bacterium]|nr:ABC transporter permease [Thermoguttaceae bacterium]MDI9443990.1 ABC transporter permease [Planctomycetota bacterium]